jgi:hypothetical protein
MKCSALLLAAGLGGRVDTNCEFGVEGPAPRSAPAIDEKKLPPFVQKCFREPGRVWGRADAEMPAFIAAVRDLGATFLVFGANPEANTPQARRLLWAGGDESTFSRLDLEKKYVTKMVHADAKDRSLWTFGDGRQGKDYRFADPYCWPGAPQWGDDGEFYMSWALCTRIDVYRPVGR